MITRFSTAAALAMLLVASTALAQTPGPNPRFMDTTCQPCKDFYRHANGAWMDTASIPPSYNGIGAGREIADRNQEVLHDVLEQTAAKAATEKDPIIRKLGIFYSVLMDSARADREGEAPLGAELKRIDAIQTREDLRGAFAHTVFNGVGGGFFGGSGVPFRVGPEADPAQSTMNIGQIFQGGLGLPERDFYFRKDPKSDSLRREYVAHMTRTLQLLGDAPEAAAARADAIMKLETALAESSMRRVDMRNPHALYHKISVKELGAICPAVDWPAYFGEIGVPGLASPAAMVDVSMPSFMRQVSHLVETTPIETWRAYLRFHTTRAAAPWMGQPFFDESFAFQSKMTGTKIAQARWKRCSGAVDRAMGEALGKAYVERAFPPSSKARMIELVNNLQSTLNERIESRAWMSAATKKQAGIKLDAVLKKIGYPDTWRDYTKLEIEASASGAELLRRGLEFEQKRQLAQIGKPVDRTEWGMSPPTVNAYYNPSINEIVFPAGILQPPQFDPRADDAVNYGSIGMVIGHELTHGFDDEGRQYDSVGNLKDWWTDDDAKKFTEKAQRVVDQYNGYIATDTLHVNGRLTLGENIADLGGLTIAYYAYQRSLKGKPAPVIGGLTGDQRFFLGYAQAWRRKLRPELLRLATLSDEHSPAEWRVNGPLSNMKEFAKAFGCKAGDAMVRDEGVRAEIW